MYDEYPGSPGKYGPYRQSERLAIYQKHAQDLLKTNQAYRCFCSDQEIEKERNQYCQTGQLNYQYSQKCRFLTPNEIAAKLTSETPCSFVIRIKTQATLAKLQFHDLIRGSVELQRNQIGD